MCRPTGYAYRKIVRDMHTGEPYVTSTRNAYWKNLVALCRMCSLFATATLRRTGSQFAQFLPLHQSLYDPLRSFSPTKIERLLRGNYVKTWEWETERRYLS
jgi:hypothetical protein